eukprot:TRINITY_DN7143_c0_g1_i1.p1 TRINITY_DN7143_c0_g1~~TRINITY_DN7143_c0_g1_i1.p1  ORF type:complete len:273 (+),score=9.12 TRINITY_DN7143_c0_g1_i1:35-853(+)
MESWIKDQKSSMWIYISVSALYAVVFLILLLKQAIHYGRLVIYTKRVLVFSLSLVFFRIIGFFTVVFAIDLTVRGAHQTLDDILSIANAFLLTFGEASLASCHLSVIFIWLDFIDRAPVKVYFVMIVSIWISSIGSTIPFVTNLNVNNYVIPFGVSAGFQLLFSLIGIIVSLNAIETFNSHVPNESSKKKFKVKGLLTLLSGLFLVGKSVSGIYLLKTLTNHEYDSMFQFYFPLLYYIVEMIPVLILNNIFTVSHHTTRELYTMDGTTNFIQ